VPKFGEKIFSVFLRGSKIKLDFGL